MTARIVDVMIDREGDEVGHMEQTITGTPDEVKERVKGVLPIYSRNVDVQYDDGMQAAA